MKKFFECIGMVTLVCCSFFFTEKTVHVVKEADHIMVEIEKAKENHTIESIDAKIEKNTIIPGLYGKIVDEEKSYEKMKRLGSYQESLLVYRKQAPNVSIEDNRDYYIISGNPKKNMITFVFLVEGRDNPSKIESILKQKDVKASFFVDETWFEKNNDAIYSWIADDYTIGNLSYHRDYANSSFVWMDTIIKKIGNQKVSFCYNEKEDQEALKICSLNHNYTIRPNIIVQENQSPLSEIKKKLTAGSIIALPISDQVARELPVVIEYIKKKGYKIENLYHHLEELES